MLPSTGGRCGWGQTNFRLALTGPLLQNTSMVSEDLQPEKLSEDVGNQNPKHCDESPEGGRHPRSLWGRPGLPGNLPARWPWAIPL